MKSENLNFGLRQRLEFPWMSHMSVSRYAPPRPESPVSP